MKKLTFLILFVLIVVGLTRFFSSDSSTPLTPFVSQADVTPKPEQQSGPQRSSLFVPYWTLSAESPLDEYETLIYFGVTPGTSGLNTEDPGYKALPSFVDKAGQKRTYLTIRMLDSKQNFKILENKVLQSALITDAINVAEEQGFDGIVLDLEVSALPFASVIDQISSFNKKFYTEVTAQELHYSVLLYGDTFFRIRPFDAKAIGESSDEVMIMAYDFHKSRGNPGPNFPLSGKEKYGYDYTRLIDQFSDAIPNEKLTVTFGLFGYDWEVDKEDNKVSHGEPLSYNQIADRFLTECQFSSCVVKRDATSSESFVTYTDDEGLLHTVWYEDLDSVAKKKAFLQTKGITSFSYWAYSYY